MTQSRWGRDMLGAVTHYKMLTKDLPRALSLMASKPEVARETKYYLERIRKISSIEEFLADNRLFAYALAAFGLGEMSYAKGFFRRLLIEGIDSPNTLANRLLDRRYREFVETFNFARHGSLTTSFTRTQQGVVDRYVRQRLEEQTGAQNEGIRLALYFERRATSLNNVYDILADRALLEVVQTALGIPFETVMSPIDRQAEMIKQKLNIDDLKDPGKLQKLIHRFLVLWDARKSLSAANPPTLLPYQPAEFGLRPDLLASLQSLTARVF
ncbi:MAG: flagellar biosynthesis protein FlgF [Proteobacteria bacterium]|nr:MAG: flagellar biosynthesis protein FlgF [Pseudomonadota bacterium]